MHLRDRVAVENCILYRRGSCCWQSSTLKYHTPGFQRLSKDFISSSYHISQNINCNSIMTVGSTATDLQKQPHGVIVYSSSNYVEEFLRDRLEQNFEHVTFIPSTLDVHSAALAKGHDIVCLFVNDSCGREVLEVLKEQGVSCIAMRCAGYDRVDIKAAEEMGIQVVRVPAYSPRSVAEAAMCLMLATARNLRSAALKVSVGNYTLNGLVGMELTGKTFGVIGTGNIGIEFIKLLKGFDGKVLAYDVYHTDKAVEAGAEYVELDRLLKESDVISLHVPLLPSTKHLMNRENLSRMKDGSILINVSRGGLIDTDSLIDMLVKGTCGIRAVGMDVYENEGSLFFTDFTEQSAKERMRAWDCKFALLKSLPQVVITPHTAFLTEEALESIGQTTVDNMLCVISGKECPNLVKST
jgi:D-lactate dehydrogenase